MNNLQGTRIRGFHPLPQLHNYRRQLLAAITGWVRLPPTYDIVWPVVQLMGRRCTQAALRGFR